jgi:hypothetical protein
LRPTGRTLVPSTVRACIRPISRNLTSGLPAGGRAAGLGGGSGGNGAFMLSITARLARSGKMSILGTRCRGTIYEFATESGGSQSVRASRQARPVAARSRLASGAGCRVRCTAPISVSMPEQVWITALRKATARRRVQNPGGETRRGPRQTG